MNIQEYKCPNCNGALKFDSGIQKMKCPFCDGEFEIAAPKEGQKEAADPAADNITWSSESNVQAWEDSELNDLATGSCPSCGVELLGDKNTVAMVCPCCGNAQIVSRRLSGLLKPNYVIPFKLGKKDAVEALKKFCEGKLLLPDTFTEDKQINNFQGIYVPFWLFDAKVRAHICYDATKTRFWSDEDYDYVETDHYSVVRDGSLAFEKVPVDGSEKMNDAYMDAIEPFDYSAIKDFDGAFLAGYTAEKYDVDIEESKGRAGPRIRKTIENELALSVTGYNSLRLESSSVNVESGSVNYALFPVWILNTQYEKEHYQFMINGESGRLVGKLPVDSGKSSTYGVLITGIIGAVFTLVIQLLSRFWPST